MKKSKLLLTGIGIMLLSNINLILAASEEQEAQLNQAFDGYQAIGKVLLFLLYAFVIIIPLITYIMVQRKSQPKGDFRLFGVSFTRTEYDKDELMDHNYDGIMELDNRMPPWLKYMFIFTITFSTIYAFHYLFLGTGKLQNEEYQDELTVAAQEAEAYKLKNPNAFDESNATIQKSPTMLEKGAVIFQKNCVVCHGPAGGGGVGPNLTDDYWIHGGNIKDLFKTVKYGVPDKGMKSWKQDLTSVQIMQVTSYIKTLKGTNPAGGKDKQGDLYSGE